MVISSPVPTMSKKPQNMDETSNSLFLPTEWLLWATIGNHGHSVIDLQCLKAPLHQWWVKHLRYPKYAFDMKFSILNGCHLWSFKMAAIVEIQYSWQCSLSPLCKFKNFPIFWVFRCSFPPPTLHVNYRVWESHVSHTGINVCAHCPLHLPKKVTEKPSVNHIGSSTSHQ